MTTFTEFNNFAESSPSVSFRSIFDMPFRKGIIVGVVIVFALFAAFICGFILLKNTPVISKKDFSYTNYFSSYNMNTSIDPCVNFYQFTCGLWTSHLNSTDVSNAINSFTILKDNVENKRSNIFFNSKPSSKLPSLVNDALEFYFHCTNFKRDNKSDIEYLLYLMKGFGGWPMLDHNGWNESSFDWIKANLYLQKKLYIGAFFGISVTVDEHDSSSHIIFISTPSHALRDLTLEEYTTQVVLYSVLNTLNPDYDEDFFHEDIDKLVKIERAWRKLISESIVPDPIQLSFNDLSEKISHFDWLDYIHDFLNDNLTNNERKLNGSSILLIENITYLEKIISILLSNSFTKREIANFYGWLIVKNSLVLIPDVINYYAEINDYDESDKKAVFKEKCFEKTLEVYECSIDYLYVQSNSNKGVTDSKIMVKYLKDAFLNIFSSSEWLDDTTKFAAIRKLKALKTILGYKNYHNNKTEFDKQYKDYPKVNENVLQTYFNIKAYYVGLIVSHFKHNDSRAFDEELPRPITDVSAYYILQKNLLVIPISLFSPPFYYNRGPHYLNFGALGSVIGHEMMHAFDKQGCRRNENGSKINWWTNNSLEKYNELAECFQNQYGSYYSSRNLSHTNLTLNENVADSEGLRIAYIAYKRWLKDNMNEWDYPPNVTYSSDQMFFISFGSIWCSTHHSSHNSFKTDVHSSPEFRVNSAVSNSEHFELAFNCSKNSNMNPESKCRLW